MALTWYRDDIDTIARKEERGILGGAVRDEKVYRSVLRHAHFRLDSWLASERVDYKEVFEVSSRLLGREIKSVSELVKLDLNEHRKIEVYFMKEWED